MRHMRIIRLLEVVHPSQTLRQRRTLHLELSSVSPSLPIPIVHLRARRYTCTHLTLEFLYFALMLPFKRFIPLQQRIANFSHQPTLPKTMTRFVCKLTPRELQLIFHPIPCLPHPARCSTATCPRRATATHHFNVIIFIFQIDQLSPQSFQCRCRA